MRSVKFDEFDAYKDFGLILAKKTIGAPAPKVLSVDIAGGNGSIDFTEYFGDINFENRALKFEFSMISNPKNYLSEYSRILNLLNGQKMKITLSDDPDYYYIGRVIVNEWESQKRIGKLVIDVDAEPYKYKHAVTLISIVADGKTVICCKNGRMKVQPKFTFSAETKVVFGVYTKVFPAGKYDDDDIIFTSGENVITITPISGTSSVTIEYQEGDL